MLISFLNPLDFHCGFSILIVATTIISGSMIEWMEHLFQLEHIYSRHIFYHDIVLCNIELMDFFPNSPDKWAVTNFVDLNIRTILSHCTEGGCWFLAWFYQHPYTTPIPFSVLPFIAKACRHDI